LLEGFARGQLERCGTQTVAIPVEVDSLALSDGTLRWLDPLAPASADPHALQEAESPALGVGAVMAAHDGFDGFGGLVSVVEWDGAHVVVEDVGFDNSVQERTADETEVTVDGCSSTTDVVPALGRVVGKRWVGVLQVGDGN